jgi:RNA polymerase sigma-70 factor, ECF subfamily
MKQLAVTGETIERFRGYLLLLARSHIDPRRHSKLEASDLVQQTLLAGFEKRGQFRGNCEAELAQWLKKILVNSMVDSVRAEGRDRRNIARERSIEAAIDDSFSRAESWLAADQTSPSEQAANIEQFVHLAACLARLPDGQREAVTLHHLQGWTLAELAAHLHRSEGAVAGLLHRGLKQLKQMLSEIRGESSRHDGP